MSLKSKFKKLMNLHPEAAGEIAKLVDLTTQSVFEKTEGLGVGLRAMVAHEQLEDLFVTAFVMGQTSALDKLRKVEKEIDEEDVTLLTTPDEKVEV